MKVLTEREFADSEKFLGAKIVENKGTFWKEIRWKFFMPVHPLKELTACSNFSLKVPFRMFISKNNSNALYPVMELSNPAAFDLISLPPKKRNQVRRGVEKVRVEKILYKERTCEEAFEVYRSFYRRTGWGDKRKLKYKRFDEWFKRLFQDERLTLGGFAENKLIGFLRGHIVEDTAYLSLIATHSEYLTSYPNEALIWRFIEMVKIFPHVSRIVFATKSKKQSLDNFKVQMGFLEKVYPARVESFIPPLTNTFAKFMMKRF
jgi:hypothetical protein